MMRETSDVFPRYCNRIVESEGSLCKTFKTDRSHDWAKSPVSPPGGLFFSDLLPREAHGGPVAGPDVNLIGQLAEIDRDREGR